jgi:hypothetical protein
MLPYYYFVLSFPGLFQRSEQLLRTLERLREETQLVAAALESMKEHVTREFHKISGIATGGNCIIAT